MNIPTDPQALFRFILSWIVWIAGLSLMAMVLVTIAARYGVRVPYIPTMEPLPLAALCVAFYCMPKG